MNPEAGPVFHEPVLTSELLSALEPVLAGPDPLVVDATYGGGGHSRALLAAGARVVAFDRDPEAAPAQPVPALTFVDADFVEIGTQLDRRGIRSMDGAIFDLGVSSRHLDEPSRGFSYRASGPLDMRMDPRHGRSAADVLNTEPEAELARIFRQYGEERFAGRIATVIVAARPLHTTAELADIIVHAIPASARESDQHPARRVFQAVRIAVNGELDALATALDAAIARLRPGGRVAVIAYHSLEDRIVKRRFSPPPPPGLARRRPERALPAPDVRAVFRSPVVPGPVEIARNPRARSARLRVAERTGLFAEET